ncbi:MAG: preprotein translocase subunit SecE [Acidobacteria bacterium]|jgi:preprotein translocase subunit SecE|nr:preprotein translocase subunit SecE [Acidobacteriota bacterium]
MPEGIRTEKNMPVWLRDWVEFPRRATEYVGEVRGEMRRVTWPGRQEIYGTTVVVIITVFVFGLFFFVVDALFSLGVNNLLDTLRGLI